MSAPAPQAAEAFLAGLDEDWARLVARVGPCAHRPRPDREPYEALVRAIAYQQLHARAGDAMLARLLALSPDGTFPTPRLLLAVGPEALRGCGFSAGKVLAMQGIAEATLAGTVPALKDALALDDETLVRRLLPLRGVGRWTVEMLLIYSLARPDVLPVDDFGVREGYRRLKGLAEQPKPRQLAQLGLAWSPHRTAAAWYLWRVPAG
ncbi:DNA-3-methyladenine glycosylase family protein [Pseudomonas mangiferae]|uniref:DNA-3-methyladenine glycosylase II n=1 Tax=Pseudomonas mangiferae TaxID=2593654 RepID=A0A553H0X7_9PSED|nr:DNA-3-methyladenine glycosylase [Pseudomonas mangiferae]TRX75381.1 DNA-3-methyladenine glycosylase 2 family protein [Pseudomonas mangiferae]